VFDAAVVHGLARRAFLFRLFAADFATVVRNELGEIIQVTVDLHGLLCVWSKFLEHMQIARAITSCESFVDVLTVGYIVLWREFRKVIIIVNIESYLRMKLRINYEPIDLRIEQH
jgi:hypothetical protein